MKELFVPSAGYQGSPELYFGCSLYFWLQPQHFMQSVLLDRLWKRLPPLDLAI